MDGHTADDVCALAQTNTVQTDEQCYFIRKRDRYIRVIWSDNFGIANIGVAMLHILRVQSSGSVSNAEKKNKNRSSDELLILTWRDGTCARPLCQYHCEW